MIDNIKKLFANASLGDYLTIGTLLFSSVSAVVAFWIHYKNRYTKMRKKYLEKINVAYNLFQHGEETKLIYDSNRYSDIVQLLQNLDKSIHDIENYHRDCPEEALEEFDSAYTDLTSSWNRAWHPHQWERWCDPAKGDFYQNGTLNWDAFSMSKFHDEYASLRGKLYRLRNQVRKSVPK